MSKSSDTWTAGDVCALWTCTVSRKLQLAWNTNSMCSCACFRVPPPLPLPTTVSTRVNGRKRRTNLLRMVFTRELHQGFSGGWGGGTRRSWGRGGRLWDPKGLYDVNSDTGFFQLYRVFLRGKHHYNTDAFAAQGIAQRNAPPCLGGRTRGPGASCARRPCLQARSGGPPSLWKRLRLGPSKSRSMPLPTSIVACGAKGPQASKKPQPLQRDTHGHHAKRRRIRPFECALKRAKYAWLKSFLRQSVQAT